MTFNRLLFGVLFAATAIAQAGDRQLDTKSRVLDLAFPLDAPSESYSYYQKLVLRYGDSDTQFVVVDYVVYPVNPGGRVQVFRYSLEGMGEGELSQLITKMVGENPQVTDQEIAAKLKVVVTRSPMEYKVFDRALKELKAIRISPVLSNRIGVDEISEYEYWWDDWQESVHYTLIGPFKHDPQDQLVQWMIRFRANLPNMMKRPSEASESKLK